MHKHVRSAAPDRAALQQKLSARVKECYLSFFRSDLMIFTNVYTEKCMNRRRYLHDDCHSQTSVGMPSSISLPSRVLVEYTQHKSQASHVT